LRDIMDRGQLVPDELTTRVVKERTAQEDCKNGYILDGFPRTPAQAASLESLAVEQGKSIVAILIDMPLDLLEKRMTGRRNCPVCGEIYNIYGKPPRHDNVCDFHPDTQLVQRADDNADTVRARLATFEAQTQPLIDYYKAADLLHVVDGTREPEAIYNDVTRILSDEQAVNSRS
jgi:adenylate kinase